MEMFLMAGVLSLLGGAVCAALFAAATRVERAAEPSVEKPEAVPASRFFAAPAAATSDAVARPAAEPVPIEALLLRIEQHIRLEQAAAESFLDTPSGQSLHSRTTSRLVN